LGYNKSYPDLLTLKYSTMKNSRLASLLTVCATLFFGIASCERSSSGLTVVEGQVVERSNGKAVPDAYVQLYQPGKSFSSGYSKVGDPLKTDGNGNFSFSYDAETESSNLLMGYSDKGHYSDWQEAPNLSSGRKNKDVKVKVYAPAWVKIKLIDELPKSRVWISIWGYNERGDFLTLPSDTVFYRSAIADFQDRVTWDITDEQAVKTRYYKDFKVAGMDTVTIEIKF
jgi:hypothetical protein